MNDAEILAALVGIPSATGDEAAAVAFLAQQARSDGLEVRSDEAGNFLVSCGAGGPDAPLLWLVGHIDTVPGHIPVRVEQAPHGPELWGRGSVDAKGCLAAFYAVARQNRDNPNLRIMLAGCVDEEGRSAGAKALPRGEVPAAIIVGEPSGADGVTIGYKGIIRGTYRLTRPVQHGGHPGGTAADALVAWWSAVQRQMEFADGFGTCTGHLDEVHTTNDGLSQQLQAHFQVRLPPAWSPEAGQACLRNHAADATVHLSESMPAAESDPRAPLVSHFRAAIRAGGHVPRLKRKTGTADFNHLATWFPGVPLVAYGPGDSGLDHTPEERLGLAEFARAISVLDDVLRRLGAR